MPSYDVADPTADARRTGLTAPIVHQASGVLMARRGTSIDEAVASLYESAQTMGVDVTRLAASVVRSTSAASAQVRERRRRSGR